MDLRRAKDFNISTRTTPVFKLEPQAYEQQFKFEHSPLEQQHQFKFEPSSLEQHSQYMQQIPQPPHVPSNYPPRTSTPADPKGKGREREA